MNTDPIADMLTRIRNANMVSLTDVEMPSSKLKVELAKLLKSEGFITDYAVKEVGKFKVLSITLKYDDKKKPVITKLERISKILEILNTTVAIAIVIPSFPAINGIIGFINPVYESFIKCPKESQFVAFFVFIFYLKT